RMNNKYESLSTEELMQLRQEKINRTTSLNNLQLALKILINSLYGAMGNQHFLYFLVENAESITSTGQVINQWVSRRVNELLNQLMDNETEKDYWIAGDTDSAYFAMGDLVAALGVADATESEKSQKLSELVEQVISPEIDRYCNELSEYF